MKFYTISEINDVFVDAFLTDENSNLLFLSIWGRDTAVQEFIARLTISNHEDSIKDIRVNNGKNGEADRIINIPPANILDKYSSRVGSDIYQNLTQVWIYDKCVMKPDLANRRVYQMFTQSQKCPDPWPLIKSVCHIPLLDNWREPIIQKFMDHGWCEFIPEIYGDGMRGLRIDLSDPSVESTVSAMVQDKI